MLLAISARVPACRAATRRYGGKRQLAVRRRELVITGRMGTGRQKGGGGGIHIRKGKAGGGYDHGSQSTRRGLGKQGRAPLKKTKDPEAPRRLLEGFSVLFPKPRIWTILSSCPRPRITKKMDRPPRRDRRTGLAPDIPNQDYVAHSLASDRAVHCCARSLTSPPPRGDTVVRTSRSTRWGGGKGGSQPRPGWW